MSFLFNKPTSWLSSADTHQPRFRGSRFDSYMLLFRKEDEASFTILLK